MTIKDPVPHESIDPHEHLASDELGDMDHLPFHGHVTPFWPMFWVFAALMFFTALTVWTSNVHEVVIGNTTIAFSGTMHILMAILIAIVKATLVGAFFMHLLYDKKVNTIVIGATIFALTLFIGLTVLDLDTRGMTSDVEVGEIYPGGNISLYKGSGSAAPWTGKNAVPDDAGGFQGNIVEYAQEAGAAAGGNHEGAAEHEAVDEADAIESEGEAAKEMLNTGGGH